LLIVCSVARRADKTSTLRRSWIILLPPQTTNCYTNGNGRVVGHRHVPARESVGTHTRRTSDTLPSAGRCCRRGTRLVPEATIEALINQTVSSSPASPRATDELSDDVALEQRDASDGTTSRVHGIKSSRGGSRFLPPSQSAEVGSH
jgi:hypothetical protein